MAVGTGSGVYFVWLATAGNPTPQIWHGDQLQVNGKPIHRAASVDDAEPGDLLAKHELTLDEIKLYSFDEFIDRYPKPERKRTCPNLSRPNG